jgi:hypothetical protein
MEKTHDKCDLFGRRDCPNIDHEVMVKVTQDVPRFYGGLTYERCYNFKVIDKLCSACTYMESGAQKNEEMFNTFI